MGWGNHSQGVVTQLIGGILQGLGRGEGGGGGASVPGGWQYNLLGSFFGVPVEARGGGVYGGEASFPGFPGGQQRNVLESRRVNRYTKRGP